MVHAKLRSRIEQLASARQCYRQKVQTVFKVKLSRKEQIVHAYLLPRLNNGNGSILNAIPQVYNPLVGFAPTGHDVGQILLRNAHIQSAHRDKRARTALITEGEFSNLAALSQCVFGVALFYLLNRNAEHLAGRCLVDFAVCLEHIEPPMFSRKPRDNSCLDA